MLTTLQFPTNIKMQNPIPFEATRSYAYNVSRYELLPRIAEIAKAFGPEPFLLRDIY